MTSTASLADLRARHADFVDADLQLNLTRGKPSSDQLDLSAAMATVLGDTMTADDGTDLRNYGGEVAAARELGARLLDAPADNVLAGGNASLELMWHTVALHALFGVDDAAAAWTQLDEPKVICPVPGYDRHFTLTERMGLHMVTVPMGTDGPDMDAVEALVADEQVVAMWNVPKYQNPTGCVYSDEVVQRIAALGASAACPTFRVLWDNAYAVHDLTDEPDELASMWAAAAVHDTLDNVVQFASTSKITWAGAGVAFTAASDANLQALRDHLSSITIGPDKVNQQRHVMLLGGEGALHDHMASHATLLRPRFAVVREALDGALGTDGSHGSWTNPAGGYFVSFWSRPGLATRIVELAGQAGVALTPAGAAFPYGRDPDDSHIRIAPSHPSIDDLQQAMEVFVTCVLLASAEADNGE